MKISETSLKKLIAFALVYIIWGTTYLAIRFAIQTIPPFLMAGIRFTTAGLLFYSWCYLYFDKKPGLVDWRKATIPGLLMFVFGNGSLTWSEQFIPSGLAALIIATLPIWMVTLDWIIFKGKRPDTLTIIGIFLGMIGVGLLSGLDETVLINQTSPGGSVYLSVFILTFAAISWSIGSLYSRHTTTSVSLQFMVSMQVLIGGIVLIIIGLMHGEWTQLSIQNISLRSVISLAYLVIFGSLITYSAYLWLLKISTPAKVGTYAFFNPLIAVLLGWVWVNEPLTTQTIVGAGFIFLSILFVNRPSIVKKNPGNRKNK
jgi:drug/metabolite transporter (DMT)-like permease